MKQKKTIEDEIIDFLHLWDSDCMSNFLRDIIPLIELYDADEENDWVRDAVGEENERNVRIIRTVYLLSRIAENHSGKICRIKLEFKKLWERLEKEGIAHGVESESE